MRSCLKPAFLSVFVASVFGVTVLAGPVFVDQAAAAGADPTTVVEGYLTSWKDDGLPSTVPHFDPKGVTEVAAQMRPLLELNDANGRNPLRVMLRGPEFSEADAKKLDANEVFSMVLQMTEGAMQRGGGAQLESYKILGEVSEKDDLSHVVARTSMQYGDSKLDQVNLISTQKRDGKWTVAMRPELGAMIGAMDKQLRAAMAGQDPRGAR